MMGSQPSQLDSSSWSDFNLCYALLADLEQSHTFGLPGSATATFAYLPLYPNPEQLAEMQPSRRLFLPDQL